MLEMERNVGNSRCQDKRESEEESMRKQGQEEFYDKFIKIQIFMKRRLKIQREVKEAKERSLERKINFPPQPCVIFR